MKTQQRIDSKFAFVMAVVMAGLFCGAAAMAADRTWDGGGTTANWSDVVNWDGDATAPSAAGDKLTFSGTANQANTNNAVVTSIWWLTLGNSGWNIDLGATRVTVVRIYVTGSSTITGDTGGNAGQGGIDINFTGSGETLTVPDDWYFARVDGQTLNVNGAGNTLILGSVSVNTGKNETYTMNAIADVIVNGAITGNRVGSIFRKSGSGTLTLNGVATYTLQTQINGGTLALGSGGSINDSTSISIGPGGTFDVSEQSAYTLSAPLTASGTATPATIKGDAAGTVGLDSLPITLVWSGASSGTDSTHPPLTIEDAELVLNNNTITVNVSGATQLGVGTYTLINAPGGISGTPNSTPVFTGTGTVAGVEGTLSVSGNSVILTTAYSGYTVTYDGNDNTGGAAPTDGNSPYAPDAEVTVLGTGTLIRTDHTFVEWNTADDGSGTPYDAGDTFTITEHTTLYAQWQHNPAVTLSNQSVSENVTNGTLVGVLSMDYADDWAATNFSITGGADAARFTISGTSLLTADVFDYETDNPAEVTIQATDGGAKTASKVFSIAIGDVDETARMYARGEVQVGTTLVATLEAMAGGVTYGVTAAAYHGAMFEIRNTDELHLKDAAVAGAALNDEYFVEVTASGGVTDSMLIKVTVISAVSRGSVFKFR